MWLCAHLQTSGHLHSAENQPYTDDCSLHAVEQHQNQAIKQSAQAKKQSKQKNSLQQLKTLLEW
jgi:hypothetical protein